MTFQLAIEYPDAGARNDRGFSQVPADETDDREEAIAWVMTPPEWVSASLKKGYLLTARRDSTDGPAIMCSRVLRTYKRRTPELVAVIENQVLRPIATERGHGTLAAPSEFGSRTPHFFLGAGYGLHDRNEYGYSWDSAWSTSQRLGMMGDLAVHTGADPTSIRKAIVDIIELCLKSPEMKVAAATFAPYVMAMRLYVDGRLSELKMSATCNDVSLVMCDEKLDGFGACLLARDAVGPACRSMLNLKWVSDAMKAITGARAITPDFEARAASLMRSRISLADMMIASLPVGPR